MARMARSQTNLQTLNGGLPRVQNQRFQNVVPKFASTQAGLDPFRGDLTNAFNSFFGQAQSALEKMQSADFEIRKMEAQNVVKERQLEAEALARDLYMENPQMRASDVPGYVEGLSEDQTASRTFLNTFRDTLGANIGDRMYGDFALHMERVNNPSAFESEAARWWEREYGDGTGDPYVDNAMQSAWARNYERARVSAAGEAIARSRAAAADALEDDIYRRASSPDFSQEDYYSLVEGMRSLHPGESTGRLHARVLSTMSAAAVNAGPEAARNFVTFLDQPRPNADGTPGQSLAEQFPRAVAEIRQSTYDGVLRATTLLGSEAVQSAGEELAGILSEPDEYSRLESLIQFRTEAIPRLMNTAGAPYQQILQLNAQIDEQVAGLQQYALNMNGIEQGALTGRFPEWMTAEDVAANGAEYIMRNADFMNTNDPALAVRAGNVVRSIVDRFGEAGISEDVQQYFAAGLLNPDINVSANTYRALMTADPSGQIARSVLGDNARALTTFEFAQQGTTPFGTTEDVLAVANSPEVQSAIREINSFGSIQDYLFRDERQSDRLGLFEAEYFGDDMAETLQETMGLDSFWDFSSWGSPEMTPQARDLIRNTALSVASLRLARGEDVDHSNMRTDIAQVLSGSMEIVNGRLTVRSTGPMEGDERDMGIAPLSRAVRNPNTGEYEDTVATFEDDIRLIREESFIGLDLGDEAFNGFDVLPAPHLAPYNGYMILNTDTNRPASIEVGSPYTMQRPYDEAGNERWDIAVWWNGSEEIEFSGNLEADRALAREVLNPGIGLLPRYNLDGEIYSYELFARPRWTTESQYTIQDIEDRAGQNIDISLIPPEQRLLYLGRQFRSMESALPLDSTPSDNAADIQAIEEYLRGVATEN